MYPIGTPARVFVDIRANPDRYDDAQLRAHLETFSTLLEELLRADADTAVAAVHPPTARPAPSCVAPPHNWSTGVPRWRESPEVLGLPLDRPRPAVRSSRGGRVQFAVDARLHRRLRDMGEAHQASVFMTVHAALAVLLARMSGQDDVVVGTAGRGPRRARRQPTRWCCARRWSRENRSGSCWIGCGMLIWGRSRMRRCRSSGWWTRWLRCGPRRTRRCSRSPSPRKVDPQRRAMLDGEPGQTRFDLQCSVGQQFDAQGQPAGLTVELTYAVDVFDEATVRGFANRFARMLEAVAFHPDITVRDVQLLDSDELRTLESWNEPGVDTGAATVASLFADRAARTPTAPAVQDADTALTYGELSARANRLARLLISLGARPEALVAVVLPRSTELVVALTAVLTSGGGYLPIDVTNPTDRIRAVLADADPLCVLTTAPVADAHNFGPRRVVLLDDPKTVAAVAALSPEPVSDGDRRAPLRPDDSAYLIYTSGSTGMPKGVLVSHRSVVHLLANTFDFFGFDESDVWTMFHSPAFDFSVWEVWGALLSGGSLVVVDHFTARTPARFLDVLRRHRVTVLSQTPTAFYQLADAEPSTASGRGCIVSALRRLRRRGAGPGAG